jgi:spore germination protein (amino acid permease)
LYILWICTKFHCFDFKSIYETALGKYLSRVFILIFLLTIFLTTIESASVEVSAMHNQFLPEIPIWQLLLFSIPASIYIVHSGFDAVLDTVLIGIFFISLSGFVLYLLTKNYKDYSKLLPFLENGLNFNFFISIIKLIGSYGSIAIIFPLFKDIRNTSQLKKYCILGFLFVIEIQMVSMTGTIATFEIDVLNSMFFPKLVQTELIRQSNFLDAGQLFVMLQIIGGWLIKLTISLYVIKKILEAYKIYNTFVLCFIGILIYISTYFASRNIFTLFKLLNIFVYIELISFIILPIIVFTIFLIRNKKTK